MKIGKSSFSLWSYRSLPSFRPSIWRNQTKHQSDLFTSKDATISTSYNTTKKFMNITKTTLIFAYSITRIKSLLFKPIQRNLIIWPGNLNFTDYYPHTATLMTKKILSSLIRSYQYNRRKPNSNKKTFATGYNQPSS